MLYEIGQEAENPVVKTTVEQAIIMIEERLANSKEIPARTS